MKKHTLVGYEYDRDTHNYSVTIGTDIGHFSGETWCRPVDYKHESQYFGFELAEMKAEIQYAKAKKRFYHAQLKALTEFFNNMTQTRTYDANAFWAIKMRKEIESVAEKMHEWKTYASFLKTQYYAKILNHEQQIARLKDKLK